MVRSRGGGGEVVLVGGGEEVVLGGGGGGGSRLQAEVSALYTSNPRQKCRPCRE